MRGSASSRNRMINNPATRVPEQTVRAGTCRRLLIAAPISIIHSNVAEVDFVVVY
jgi:hypothetical protein